MGSPGGSGGVCAGKHPVFLFLPGRVLPRLRGLDPRDLCGGSSGRDALSNPVSHHFSLPFGRGNPLASKGTTELCPRLVRVDQTTGATADLQCEQGLQPWQSSHSVPLVPSRAGEWCGCTWARLGHPAAIPSQRSRGSMAELQPSTLQTTGNGRTINFPCTFVQEGAGLWSVLSHLARQHLPPVSPAVPRAAPGPRPP